MEEEQKKSVCAIFFSTPLSHTFSLVMRYTSLLSSIGALSVAGIVPSTQAWFVRPPTDLISKAGAAGVGVRYKKVPPGICETRDNITTLSGFADIDADRHMYFQFIETRNGNPKKAPLTIFLNGAECSDDELLLRTRGPC